MVNMPNKQITGSKRTINIYLKDHKDNKRIRYEDISFQINREDNLINNRLKWVLQLNGFLFTALGFIGIKSDTYKVFYDFFTFWIPLTGLSISLGGLLGVLGAMRQITYLTDEFKILKLEYNNERVIRPFGDKRENEKRWKFWTKYNAYNLGHASCIIPPIILMVTWIFSFCYLSEGFLGCNLVNWLHSCPTKLFHR